MHSLTENSRASPTLRPSPTPHSQLPISSWFDADCWAAKKFIRQFFRSLQPNPSPDRLNLYFSLRKACTSFLESKKHSAAQQSWNLLYHAIQTNNHKQFWALVSRSSPLVAPCPSTLIFILFIYLFYFYPAYLVVLDHSRRLTTNRKDRKESGQN